jgi:dTDP-4-dehydrorhamnose 3,5-epimerase
MNFTPLPIDGAWEITLERRGDARGWFARGYCDAEFAANGLNTAWVQCNQSFSAAPGTLRGLHFQRPPHAEIKLVRALRGRVLDVMLDLRAGSRTLGRHVAVTLDAERMNAVYIPAGCAHGFQTLTDDCELLYAHSAAYAPEAEGGVDACDPALGIEWPLPVAARSPRDAGLPPLDAVDPMLIR